MTPQTLHLLAASLVTLAACREDPEPEPPPPPETPDDDPSLA